MRILEKLQYANSEHSLLFFSDKFNFEVDNMGLVNAHSLSNGKLPCDVSFIGIRIDVLRTFNAWSELFDQCYIDVFRTPYPPLFSRAC